MPSMAPWIPMKAIHLPLRMKPLACLKEYPFSFGYRCAAQSCPVMLPVTEALSHR